MSTCRFANSTFLQLAKYATSRICVCIYNFYRQSICSACNLNSILAPVLKRDGNTGSRYLPTLLFINRDEGIAVCRKSNANLIILARVCNALHFTSIHIIALTLYLSNTLCPIVNSLSSRGDERVLCMINDMLKNYVYFKKNAEKFKFTYIDTFL